MEILFHRFHDKVAFCILPNKMHGTIYLTAEEAEELSETFSAYAKNVKATSFLDSQISGDHAVEIKNVR